VIRLTCLGTSDAFNGAGRAHSCYWVDDPIGAFTVDFGPTALLQVRRLGLDLDRLDAIYLTHLHGDHIGGLAVLLCELHYRRRRARPLVIAGPPGHEARVAALLDSAYPTISRSGLCFPLIHRRFPVPGAIDLDGRHVTVIRARHDTHAIATSLRITTGKRELAFSGDTGWQPELIDLCADADVFLCECSSVAPGYWGHLSLAEIETHRASLTPKRLWLTHLSDESRPAALKAADALQVTVAEDGMRIELA
jgi:ribonuclease BN (tRNA processing enzyme)